MDFSDAGADDAADAGGTTDAFPAPDEAEPADVERYNEQFLRSNPDVAVQDSGPADGSNAVDMPFAKAQAGVDGDPAWKSEFPWLYDPAKGARWDFDPVELRTLAQENAWVQMMVQSISKEIAETPWTIVEADGARETDKRLSTPPGERTPIEKNLPDAKAEEIYDDLRRPVPHLDWSDASEMWMRDYLEVGSKVGTKAFDEKYYDDKQQLTVDAAEIEPLALQPTAPEVWTKDYSDKSGIPSGYWQFTRRSSPGGSIQSARGVGDPVHFDPEEVLWSDHSPATNRRYGDPPTLFVREMLRSVDLAVTQEQQYLSRGSIPSGAWVFEEWDREQVLEWKENNAENIKGKPHKSLMFAGRGGDVSFEPMSMNFQELEFTDRMRWYARVISAAFQVPTAVVGIEPEKVNYNTFQGERENFETNTLGPYLQDFERWLNNGYMMHYPNYRFEFTPGMSETTKQMRSDRIRQEWNANLRTRTQAARELGIDVPEDAEDGFKADVVDEPEQDAEGLLASAGAAVDAARETTKGDPTRANHDVDPGEGVGTCENTGETFECETMGDLAGDCPACGEPLSYIDEADLDDSDDAEKATAEKDEPLRETDDWQQFDVQPGDIDALASDLAADFEGLFEDVLSDEEIQSLIDSMAAEADSDETQKSTTAIARRLKELLADHDLADSIQTRLEDSAVEEALETARDAIEAADADADVDERAIRSQLRDRTQAFADNIAQDMAEDIRETVGDGWAEGKNSREIAQDIAAQSDYEQGWGGAERIARQELQIASGLAREEVAADLNKVEVWETAGDSRVRDAHANMQGKWKRPGEEFVVEYERGLKRETVPGDSEPGIGCRCVTLLRDREEVDEADHAGSDGL